MILNSLKLLVNFYFSDLGKYDNNSLEVWLWYFETNGETSELNLLFGKNGCEIWGEFWGGATRRELGFVIIFVRGCVCECALIVVWVYVIMSAWLWLCVCGVSCDWICVQSIIMCVNVDEWTCMICLNQTEPELSWTQPEFHRT